jgi:hypothetical protein
MVLSEVSEFVTKTGFTGPIEINLPLAELLGVSGFGLDMLCCGVLESLPRDWYVVALIPGA